MSSLHVFMMGFGIGALFVLIAMAIITDPVTPIVHLYMGENKYECITWESHVVCEDPPTKAAAVAP